MVCLSLLFGFSAHIHYDGSHDPSLLRHLPLPVDFPGDWLRSFVSLDTTDRCPLLPGFAHFPLICLIGSLGDRSFLSPSRLDAFHRVRRFCLSLRTFCRILYYVLSAL
jgi:hypothetical protein